MRFSYFYIFVLAFYANISYAEGGCPAGQYPIGGQGAVACAPIPQSQTQQAQPTPIGKWIKTWGAVALDRADTGAIGASIGKISESDARQDAIHNCIKGGGTECKGWTTYENQCIAIAEPYKGEKSVPGSLQFVTGPSLEKIKGEASEKCTSKNNMTCRVFYSDCSEPIFEKF
ncbi:DUF4189 domain-containing protein [Pseudomonas syringae]|uniref:DUF4189 domain-containing protein n=1 Tax=Pseudomonas syringae TaxID=317 RepID=UPI000BB5B65A|nr:DUF4189 domain-containing protein [Pseudomonas syringae]PBP86157.1 hypothetical protein CCL22_01970 [Pseudomonas syringae]